MKESEIEARLVRGVKALGGVAYKFVSPGNVGVPDRVVVLPGGRVIFVELKAEGGAAEPDAAPAAGPAPPAGGGRLRSKKRDRGRPVSGGVL